MDFCYWAPRHDDLAEGKKEVWASFQDAGFWRSARWLHSAALAAAGRLAIPRPTPTHL
jgi:hypothetical protein